MILILAEKPIAGARIATILSSGRARKKTYRKHPYWEFELNGRPAVLVPLKGHIIDVDFLPELNRWSEDTLSTLPDAPLEHVVTERTVASLLKSLAPKVEEIIIATDADREGEAIGLESAELVMKYARREIPLRRAYFSALTKRDILSAFENLREPKRALAESAFTRREIDLIWGAALTRAISLYSNRRGKAFLSIGRVQSPTLAIIVEREREIERFVPIPYWTIDATLAFSGEKFSARYAEGQIWQEPMAQMLYKTAKAAKQGTVTRVELRQDKIPRPVPFDTTTFLREANKHLGLPTSEALKIAESLYMKGLISYPRTDNQTYPPSLGFRGILNKLKSVKNYAPFAEELLQQDVFRPSSGRKADDHPPIHPVDVSKGKLSEKERKVYDLIARRFLATLMAPGTLERRNVHININGVPFVAEGRRITQKGWTAVYPVSLRESAVPPLSDGDRVDVVSLKLAKSQTKPPSRYSEGELVKRMEALGLGTKSTRAEIIAKLFARKYISGRKAIKPTELGRKLVEVLERYAPELATPNMTAELEKALDAIAAGEKTKQDVFSVSADRLKSVLNELSQHKSEIRQSLGDEGGAAA
ncbi:MAG: DNA topoisomerase I [Candidatus Diapherotrites archaeon]|nr:DNA topoisomerase I [Candidatus Diapherotrites archaeon]